jgi:hypothetical protein
MVDEVHVRIVFSSVHPPIKFKVPSPPHTNPTREPERTLSYSAIIKATLNVSIIKSRIMPDFSLHSQGEKPSRKHT